MTELVRSLGTVRRLRALVAIGWTNGQIAEAFNLPRRLVCELLDDVHSKVEQPLARYVALRYERLSGTYREGPIAEAMRAHAKNLGWPSTLAWHDIDIDDSQARARGSAWSKDIDEEMVELAVSGQLPAGEKLRQCDAREAVRRMLALNMRTCDIARRAHVSDRTVHRQGVRRHITTAAA
jgi:hypothetical protein